MLYLAGRRSPLDLRAEAISGIKPVAMNPDFYITTVLMGYGHLRAADNVAGLGRGRLVRVDRPPFASLPDIWVWKSSQDLYHVLSRTVETRLRFLFRVLERIEDIPDDSKRASMEYSVLMRALVRTGVGRGLRQLGAPAGNGTCPPRLHTFFLPGLACVYNRVPGKNYQLLCDADFHRVWAPIKPNDGDVTYLVPTAAGADRLISYGVAHERIVVTGFPLPVANTGGKDLDGCNPISARGWSACRRGATRRCGWSSRSAARDATSFSSRRSSATCSRNCGVGS